jgi:2-polyprenyl-3-methyl-5-hydroxy-6-metoxy-1,4-benzoquinol methylase
MLVAPLEEAWLDAIARVLAAHKLPPLQDTARLGPLVARLSEAYNTAGTASRELLPARLAFSFARDVPKGAGAVRELVGTSRLALPSDRALRVLDLGAGLGATTWGVARALEAAGQRGEIDATWVDADGAALALGTELVAARGETPVKVRARTITANDAPRGGPRFDLVLMGQVLSELDHELAPDARVEAHAVKLQGLLEHRVSDLGSLVVVEPALRERTRHLHAVRDRLLALAKGAANVFAPCLHQGACPALATVGDWCHEDLPVDLPPWLVPIARAAGLRWQGLTFSYLVLRKDGASLAERGMPYRVISGPLVTKGKRELFLCGAPPALNARPARARVQRIDRHRTEANQAWDELGRGDLVAFTPMPELPAEGEKGVGKIGPATRVDVAPAKAY